MQFKRPQVRYADTPQPATPYQSAAQVWDERIRLDPRAGEELAFHGLRLPHARAADGGRLVAFGAVHRDALRRVEVDNAGQVRAVGEAATPYKPSDAQVASPPGPLYHLVRSLSIDPIVVRQNWLDAYDYTTDKGAWCSTSTRA